MWKSVGQLPALCPANIYYLGPKSVTDAVP